MNNSTPALENQKLSETKPYWSLVNDLAILQIEEFQIDFIETRLAIRP